MRVMFRVSQWLRAQSSSISARPAAASTSLMENAPLPTSFSMLPALAKMSKCCRVLVSTWAKLPCCQSARPYRLRVISSPIMAASGSMQTVSQWLTTSCRLVAVPWNRAVGMQKAL